MNRFLRTAAALTAALCLGVNFSAFADTAGDPDVPEAVITQSSTDEKPEKAVVLKSAELNKKAPEPDTNMKASEGAFAFLTEACNEDGYGKLTVSVKDSSDYSPDADYSVSINGGKYFIPTDKGSICFSKLKSGSYNICVMKNGDTGNVSDIKAVYVGGNSSMQIYADSKPCSTYKDGQIVIHFMNYDADEKYMYSANGGKTWNPLKGPTVRLTDVSRGDYGIIFKSSHNETSDLLNVHVDGADPEGKAMIHAPMIKQLPELPTGCEVTSLTMALAYNKIKVSKTTLADRYLDKGGYRTADYKKVFVGDPRESFAYGCYSDVIVNCAEKFLEDVPSRNIDVVNITGCEVEDLYTYLDMGYPVIVWATSKMVEPKVGAQWTEEGTGKPVVWVAYEHCLLMTGYDIERNAVYFNDPQYGVVGYDSAVFEERFTQLENQAVVLIDRDKTDDE